MSLPHFDFTQVRVTADIIQQKAKRIFPNIQEAFKVVSSGGYTVPESFTVLPNDKSILSSVRTLARKKLCPNLAGAVVIGVGGSSLGAQACYKALDHQKELIFIQNTDPCKLEFALKKLEKAYSEGNRYLLILVSKSGKTTEALASFGAILEPFSKLEPVWRQQVVVISAEGSPLAEYSRTNGFDFLEMPPAIGGRFSVFTSAGLFPLEIAGINTAKLLNGASKMQTKCGGENTQVNPALSGAVSLFLNWQAGKTDHNIFVFSSRFRGFAYWYRQLMGESLGKSGKGITPLVSSGSEDLHSVGQLFFEGFLDKFTTFLSVGDFGCDFLVGSECSVDNLVPNIEGKSLSQITKAILTSVKASYVENSMPYMDIIFDSVDEEAFGALLQEKMLEILYTAYLMEVNPFGQPDVERYKTKVCDLLANSK